MVQKPQWHNIEVFCSPWSQYVDDGSTVQDAHLHSGGGEKLFHWIKVFQAGHQLRLFSNSQTTHLGQRRLTGLVLVLKNVQPGEEGTVVFQG